MFIGYAVSVYVGCFCGVFGFAADACQHVAGTERRTSNVHAYGSADYGKNIYAAGVCTVYKNQSHETDL